MEYGILKKIENITIDLNCDSETIKIAKYLLENFRSVSQTSITKIAKECQTSPTKITRFSERLGLKGFSELKLRLSDISKSVIIDGNLVNVSDSIAKSKDVFFDKYIEIHNEAFSKQFIYLKNKDISSFIHYINKAKFIYLFAFNLSYNVSKNFIQRMRWYGLNIISESDLISIETYLNTIGKDDLVILITISGTNKIIEELAEKLHGRTKLLGLVDVGCKFKDKFDDYLHFETRELQLWNINSIKAQMIIQLLDYIFVNWIIQR